MSGAFSMHRGMRYAFIILVRKRERKSPLARLKHRCEDSINMYLKEIRCEGLDCIHLAQVRDHWCALMKMVINPWV
jgi:hypothetical protein